MVRLVDVEVAERLAGEVEAGRLQRILVSNHGQVSAPDQDRPDNDGCNPDGQVFQ
jgi:hypothetical protein